MMMMTIERKDAAMNRFRIAAVSAGLLLGGFSFAADAPPVDPLVKQLAGEGAPAARSAAEFEAAYAKVLPSLLTKPETDDVALQRISFHASRPGAEVERAALSKVLASKLPDASPAVRVVLLRHIQRIGREETVVPVLRAMLTDKDALVRDGARRALANNPTSAAADALRSAIDATEDATLKGALLIALAERRDWHDAPTFAKAAASTDEAVRLPALLALAHVGGAADAKVLAAARDSGSDAAKAAANDAYLLLADRLITLDQKAAAAKIYREYLFSPQRYRYAAIIGIGVAGSDEEVAKLLNVLSDKDPQARGAVLQALSRRRDPRLANEIVARLPKSDASTKPWLLRALIGQNDKRAAKLILEAASDPDGNLRILALTALARLGDASAVPALLKSAGAKGEEQIAARNTLEMLPGQSVDAALLDRAAAAAPAAATGPIPERTEAIRALGARRTPAAVEPLFAAARDTDPAVRSEALKSLALVANFDALPGALKLLLEAKDDADRDQAIRTVVAIARKNDNIDARVAPLVTEAERAEGLVKVALLSAMGQLGGAKALQAIRAAVKSSDEKTHEAGVRALASWPDTTPLDELVTLAKQEKSNTLSVLSLRGYVRLVGLPNKRPAVETIKLYQDAMSAAKRNDERKMVLGGLGEVKDVKALEVVAPFLEDEALVNEACAAAIKIAKESGQSNKDLAKTTMNKVLEVSKNEGQKKAAKNVLSKLEAPDKTPA
jgi:HEAT repeat protein